MKYKVTLNGKTYEVEVEAGKAMLVDEYEAYAPAPAPPRSRRRSRPRCCPRLLPPLPPPPRLWPPARLSMLPCPAISSASTSLRVRPSRPAISRHPGGHEDGK